MTTRNVHWLSQALPVLGCFGGGSLYGWSGLLPAVQNAFDVGNASASMVFSFALVSFTFGVLIGPALLAKLPARACLPAISGLAVASLLLSARAQAFEVFVLGYGIGFGFAAGALYNHALGVAAASRLPTLLVPVSVAAFGLGGVVFGPMSVWLIGLGWSLGALLPVLGCMVLIAAVSSVTKPALDTNAIRTTVRSEVIKPNRVILLLWAIFATGSCAGLIVLGLAPKLLPSGTHTAGMAVFGVAAGNTLGRLSAAGVATRFGPLHGFVGAVLLSMAALSALLVPGVSEMMMTVLIFLVALSYGQIAAQTPLLVSARVPAPAFSSAFGWVFTGWGVAGLLGPWGAGWLYDQSGDMRLTLQACIGFLFLSLLLITRLPATDPG
ncbi:MULTISPECIES: nitrate/nitrite transporter [unclassified Ruegeria]|uniref:MFS transporter n=1 Tax=unclassified Ruegeria TaxID=2625375 RepID=UPI001489818C|nr:MULTISPECIES: hypothetical protein [unclassified Ruegeria]